MKVTQMSPVHAANLVVNSGNTTYGVGVSLFYLSIFFQIPPKPGSILPTKAHTTLVPKFDPPFANFGRKNAPFQPKSLILRFNTPPPPFFFIK